MVQPSLFDPTPPVPTPPRFDGRTFDADADGQRLAGQLERVRALMADGTWRTLAEIAARVGGSEAGVSARTRDLKKKRFGGHKVEKRRRGGANKGLWEYRLILRSDNL